MTKLLNLSVIAIIIMLPLAAGAQTITDQILWKQGTGKYNNYRIPSLVISPQGTILAFCEGREAGDAGDINLLLRRSADNGLTWNEEIVVWDDGTNTCGNPCPVVDHSTGRVWLFMTWNNGKDHERDIINKRSIDTRVPYLCYSDDDGLTWSRPEAVHNVKDQAWGWYATGPGIGIQLKRGIYKGRLVVPANHSYDDPDSKLQAGPYGYGSHIIYSDDHGKTWHLGQAIKPGCNESQLAELEDGKLVMNMRSYNDRSCRAISLSSDGGATWTEIEHDPYLVESKCQASLYEYGSFNSRNLYLFSNPAVPSGRRSMTIKASFDNCRSWSNSKLVWAGPSAYSCLAGLNNGHAAILFECGTEKPYEAIRFLSFSTEELFKPGTLVEKHE
ncbi:MAG: sialidase family protein [Bacteroidales bacterium]